jgi:hypothetical protein
VVSGIDQADPTETDGTMRRRHSRRSLTASVVAQIEALGLELLDLRQDRKSPGSGDHHSPDEA